MPNNDDENSANFPINRRRSALNIPVERAVDVPAEEPTQIESGNIGGELTARRDALRSFKPKKAPIVEMGSSSTREDYYSESLQSNTNKAIIIKHKQSHYQ